MGTHRNLPQRVKHWVEKSKGKIKLAMHSGQRTILQFTAHVERLNLQLLCTIQPNSTSKILYILRKEEEDGEINVTSIDKTNRRMAPSEAGQIDDCERKT
jgi:hypothetical protein